MGVDPGLGGGIAILHPNDGILLEPMPVIGNELDLVGVSKLFAAHAAEVRFAYLEQVHAMPGQGVSSMFKFGKVYGALQGLLICHQIPTIDVRPQAWMKVLHEGISRDLDPKERSRIVFSKLFPHVDARRSVKCRTPDMGLVDAALIAEYGRRANKYG